jgi:hypothetical protein
MLEGGRNSRPNFIKHGQLGTVHHTMIDLSTNPRPPSTERVFFYIYIPFTICYLFITL